MYTNICSVTSISNEFYLRGDKPKYVTLEKLNFHNQLLSYIRDRSNNIAIILRKDICKGNYNDSPFGQGLQYREIMSDNLRRNILLKHIKKVDAVIESTAERSSSEVSLNESQDTLGSMPSFKNTFHNKHSAIQNTDTADLETWNEYFDKKENIRFDERNFSFNTYYTLPKNTDASSIPIFIFHHGAGSSGLSFANLARTLSDRLDKKCGCIAFDARGHGKTTVIDSDIDVSYDRNNFIDDLKALIEYVYSTILMDIPTEKLSIILLGHSLGGSICTFTFPNLSADIRKYITGVAMLDIVEEAAKEALNKVDHFLSVTPNVFKTYHEAIDWYVRHGLSKNRISANIAVPSLFKKFSSGKVVRITNLQSFRPFWSTWFDDLSHCFVALPTSKLLILAGNDNLDKELIIGQMQGKYQLVVFQESGHFIQEDEAYKTAITLIDFWKRNDNKNIVIKTNWGNAK